MDQYESVRVTRVSRKTENTRRSYIQLQGNFGNSPEKYTNADFPAKTNHSYRPHFQSQVNPIISPIKYTDDHSLSAVKLSTTSSSWLHSNSLTTTAPSMANQNGLINLSYITSIANPSHKSNRREQKKKYRRICIITSAVCAGLFLLGIIISVCVLLLVKPTGAQQPTTTVTTATIIPTTINTLTTMTETTTTITTKTTTTSTSSSSTTTMLHTGWNTTAATVAGSATGVAGIGIGQLNAPIGLAIDSFRTLYIADRQNNRTQKWLMGASSGTTVAGLTSGISGTTANYLNIPRDVELDSSGNIYIPDAGNHRVVFWAVGASSGTVVAGNGTSGSTNDQLNSPYGVAHNWNTGILYVADTYNDRIMSYVSGSTTGTMVIGGTGLGTTQFTTPTGLYFDVLSNSLVIANSGANNVVRWVVGAATWILVAGDILASSGTTSILLNYPRDVTLDSMSNVYVADANNHRIQFFVAGQSNGTTIAGTGTAGSTSTMLDTPVSLVVDSQFNVYVADLLNNRVQRFDHY